MPESELWPAGPGSEPVTREGSRDSMTSATSARLGSTDSYDFLSEEEKECLLFLEETIGSLDADADSGLSTEESEPTTPRAFRALPVTQPAPQGKPELVIQRGPDPRRLSQASSCHPPEPQGLGLRGSSYSLPRNIHIGRSQSCRTGTTQENGHFPGAAEREKELAGCRGDLSQALAGPLRAALDSELALIPPPVAFQDPRPQQRGEQSLTTEPGLQGQVPQLRASVSPPKREETSSEAMSWEASERGSTGGPGRWPPPAQPPQKVGPSEAPLPARGDPDAHPAPLPAQKPRKLPPNIILKSSRSSSHRHPQHWLSPHSEAGDSGPLASSVQEQRKARREALEKLGLPQDRDEAGLHKVRPASSVRLKEAQGQGASPAPAQPAAPGPVPAAVPAAEKVLAPFPASARGSSPMKAAGKIWTPPQEASPGKAPAAQSMPIPIQKAPNAGGPRTPPKPASGLTLREGNVPGLRQMNFKSNTLERSGVGLSSYFSAEKDPGPPTSTSLGKTSFLEKGSPSVLRNSRPRPASLGTGKDFAGIQVGKLADLEQDQGPKRLSYHGQSREKLPRSPCISVRISPKGVPDEHRREALKKLGLLKE